MAGKKKDFSDLHGAIIKELTGSSAALSGPMGRGDLHKALTATTDKKLTLGQLSSQLKALCDEGKIIMTGERRTARYQIAKSTSKPAKPSKAK